MRTWNPTKKLKIQIDSNGMNNCNGHTVWHVINGERKRAMSRNADGKDFDWMTDKQLEDFTEKGKYTFQITAADASQYFQYIP